LGVKNLALGKWGGKKNRKGGILTEKFALTPSLEGKTLPRTGEEKKKKVAPVE